MIEHPTVEMAPAPVQAKRTKRRPDAAPARRKKNRKATRGEDTIDAILLRLDVLRRELQTADSEATVIGLTSCSRRCGVSMLAGKMAVRAAELSLGRILLIDANLDHPRQARNFGLKRKAGLADALTGDGRVEDKLYNGQIDGLTVMPAGAPSLRNLGTSPEACSSVMTELRHGFDLVLVDLPPIGDSAKFLIFAQQMDGLAVVVDARTTRAREVAESMQMLEGGGVPFIGTILNRKTRTLPKLLDRLV